jgi:predicted permease
VLVPFLEHVHGPVRPALWLLSGSVGLLLLLACANISTLTLARESSLCREQAVRIALGATRVELARARAFETLLLSAAGGLLGLLASRPVAGAIVALVPGDVPRIGGVSLDAPVMFVAVTTLAVAILCGLGPVRHVLGADLAAVLVGPGRSTRPPRRGRSMLLAVQVALAVVLLLGAGLIVRSFSNLRDVDLGFVPDDVLTMHVTPRGAAAVTSGNAWFGALLDEVAAMPGVVAAGAVYLPPLALGPIGQETYVLLEGQADEAQARRENPTLNYQVATPGYFSAMRIPLSDGRVFDSGDDARSPRVAVVSESAARRLWPGQSALGRRMAFPAFTPGDNGDVWRTVVGVVSDVRYRGLGDARLDVYDAALQARPLADDLVVRTAGDPLAAAGAIHAAARRLDPLVVVDRIATLDAVVATAMAPWRLGAWILSLFGAAAVTLVVLGLVSFVSFDVATRRRELAIRLAVGAAGADILRAVLTGPGRWAGAGMFAGLLIAAVGSLALRGFLFGIEPWDAGTYGAVAAGVLAAVTLAAVLPAWRATTIDPMTQLRRD